MNTSYVCPVRAMARVPIAYVYRVGDDLTFKDDAKLVFEEQSTV